MRGKDVENKAVTEEEFELTQELLEAVHRFDSLKKSGVTMSPKLIEGSINEISRLLGKDGLGFEEEKKLADRVSEAVKSQTRH